MRPFLVLTTAIIAAALPLAVACSPGVARSVTPPAATPTVERAAPTTTAVLPDPPPCEPSALACVSLSENRAWLMHAGQIDYGPVPISHGGPGKETPVGTFRVAWKDIERTSPIYHTPMPYSVFFATGGIAFHGGPITENSHGCVHLDETAAPRFFAALPVGAVVQVVA